MPSNLYTIYGQGTRGSNGAANDWGDTANSGTMNNHIVANVPGSNKYGTTGDTAWRGPYIPNGQSDPWGRSYEVNVRAAYTMTGTEQSAVFCLSPGPNGAYNTTFLQAASTATVGGDDIAIRIR